MSRVAIASIVALIVLAALGYAEWRVYAAGEAHVQAQWDSKKAAQAQAAVDQTVAARATEQNQVAAFAGIEQTYIQDSPYAHALAPSTSAALAAGSLRVRGCEAEDAQPSSHPVSFAATHTGRRGPTAATSAAHGPATAIPAVRAVQLGDDADAREQQLREQVIALRALLHAERQAEAKP